MTTRHQALSALKTLKRESFYQDETMLNKVLTYLKRPASAAHFLGLKENTIYNVNGVNYIIKFNKLFSTNKNNEYEIPLEFEALDIFKYNYEDNFMSNMYEIPDVEKLESLRQDAIIELEVFASLGFVDRSNDYLIKDIYDYLTNKASLSDHLGWREGYLYFNITDKTGYNYKIQDGILYRQINDDFCKKLNLNEDLDRLLKTLELKG